MKQRRRDLSLVLAACALLGCDADENGVDPKGGTPYDRVEVDGVKIWQVKWDNPVVGALYELPSIGFAQTAGYAWEYNKFDLELEVDDADPQHRLYTWPETGGIYGDDESSFFFEGHGMKLEPMVANDLMSSISTATGMEDPYNGPEQVLQDLLGNSEGRFQLDPSVGLVPLRVVVLHGQGLTSPGFSGPALPAGWLSHNDAKLLFDDMWKGSKSVNNNQPWSPDHVVTQWTHHPGTGKVARSPTSGGGRFLQPDRVLDQCDAQFRMLSYHSCEVPPDILYDDKCGSALQQTGHFNTVQSWVDDNCDVPDDVAKVIFVGSLGAGGCVAGKLQGAQHNGDVMIANMFADKKTLPHELGHLLGLGHVSTVDNLMGPGTGIDLDGEQCPKVNENAKKQQLKAWPESESSAFWKPPEGMEYEGQFAAQEFWESLDEEQRAAVEEMLGSHLESVLHTIWGEPSDWHRGRPALESLVIAHLEHFAELLDDEQYEMLMSVLEG